MRLTQNLLTMLILLAALTPPAAAQFPLLSPPEVSQGGMARVTYAVPAGRQVEKASLVFDGNTLPCFVRDGQVVGFLAVAARTKPGGYRPTLWVRYTDGAHERFTLSLAVKARSFPSQSIKMAPSKTKLMSYDVLRKEREIIYGAMEGTAPEPLWEGVFINPLEGRISSPFGRRRYVNGRFWGQHSGIDVAAPAGKAVKATNSGRVLLAQKLWMRGDTVMIDHGMGIFSLYNHLSRMDVQSGQMVRKGHVIGLVGATGFATGPHLHWEVRIHSTPTDPAGPMQNGIAIPGH